jgi:hypothetical protein
MDTRINWQGAGYERPLAIWDVIHTIKPLGQRFAERFR